MILKSDFYLNSSVVEAARHLLGKILVTKINNKTVCVRIVETEAYCGFDDAACHAAKGKTSRNAPMFASGGICYVYLCYGIHKLFNVVTNKKGIADAVLVRAAEPMRGTDTMLSRRNKSVMKPDVLNGPGKLSQALGIDLTHNRTDLTQGRAIWIEDATEVDDFVASHRVGVDYAGEDAFKNYRFRIRNHPYAGGDLPSDGGLR